MTLTDGHSLVKLQWGFNLYDNDYKESVVNDPLALVDHPKANSQSVKRCLRGRLLWDSPAVTAASRFEPWSILRVPLRDPVISSMGCLINGDVLGIHLHITCLNRSEEPHPLSHIATSLHPFVHAGAADVQR